MRLIAHAFVCTVLVALVACGGGPDEGEGPDDGGPTPADTGGVIGEPDVTPPAGGETASGPAVWAANCATCHGDDGTGNGPAAIGLEPPPADLTDGQWTTGDGSLAAIRNTIENGSPGTAMIAWEGTLTPAEIDAAAQHVQSLGGGPE